MISENCCNFIVLKYKELQTIIAMITEDKVTELFCIADDFCKFFDAMMEKYTLKADKKRQYHRKSTMSKAEIMVIMILFHDSCYRCLKYSMQGVTRRIKATYRGEYFLATTFLWFFRFLKVNVKKLRKTFVPLCKQGLGVNKN